MLIPRSPGLSRRLQDLASRLPSLCAVCHAWPSQRICNACAARFAQPLPRCQRCALAVPEGVPVCGGCLQRPPAFDACLAAVDYAYPWSDLLADFKFQGDPGWARPLALLLRSTPWIEPALEAADRVLPIPLSVARLRARGFNQAALLAEHLAPGKADALTLLRLKDTEAQSSLPRAERLRNLQGAFVVEPARAAALHGQRVVLLDDVMTTGATAEAATVALRAVGVAHVTVVVLARTAMD